LVVFLFLYLFAFELWAEIVSCLLVVVF